MSAAEHPLKAVRSLLESIASDEDVPRLRHCLEGRNLPALGGRDHPADVLYRALALPPYRPEMAAQLAVQLAMLCDEAARSMAETLDTLSRAASEIGRPVSVEWEDLRDGERYLFGLFLLASYLPAEATLCRALTDFHRVARRAGSLLGGASRAGRQLRRALACQQVDDRLEGLWLGLIERVENRAEGEAGNRLTAQQKEDLLDAWAGLLWIPPPPAERESAATVSVERAARGLLALYRASASTPDGVAILRHAVRRLDEAYPRSPEFWRERLAPHLPRWPEELATITAERWPLLAANALKLAKTVPRTAAKVWEAVTADERDRIAQSAAVGDRETWKRLWHQLLAGEPRPGLPPRGWRRGLAEIQQALEDRFPALAPELEEPAAEEPRSAGAAPASAAEPEVAAEGRRKAGQAYQVSFLSIEVAETDRIAQARRENPQGLATLFASFRDLVRNIAATYGGESFSWSQAGGVLIFWRARSFDHATMTGLKVLHNLPVFNLDPAQNPLSIPVRIRAAAHDAVVIFERPPSRIRSAEVDFVVELQRQYADPSELAITRRLYDRIDGRLKAHFHFKGRFADEPIYGCRLPSSQRRPEERDLEDLSRLMKLRISSVSAILGQPPAAVDVPALESVSTAVDEIYSLLNRFCNAFSDSEEGWPRELYARLADVAGELTRGEEESWRILRKSFIRGKLPAAEGDKLEAIVRAASRRRSRPVVILEKLGQRFRVLAGAEAEAPDEAARRFEADDGLIKSLKAFISADALDSVTLLTELLLNRKSGFLEFLRSRTSDQRHRPLLAKLWETADLVLLDDLYSIRGRRRSDEARVIDTLVGDEVADRRFRLLRRLLESAEEPQEAMVLDALANNGRPADEADLQIVWRCLVLGHPSADLRHSVAWRLSRDSMWQAISHPSIPITSIQAIGERVKQTGQEDTKKIFFDCIRARLEAAVDSFDDGGNGLSSLTAVILQLLDFSFLVESGYFERFDDLLRRFLERANDEGLKVEYFENLRKTLDREHKKGDRGPSRPPAGLKKLPLTIQRRLAGESTYLYWFVTHPDPRIARETLRHIGLANVERVLRLKEVNQAVFAALLKKPELFTRTQAQLAALHNPKCEPRFAGRYLSTLARSAAGRRELKKIADDPSANPAVRGLAKRAVTGRAGRAGARRL